jgi:hypothetical protein
VGQRLPVYAVRVDQRLGGSFVERGRVDHDLDDLVVALIVGSDTARSPGDITGLRLARMAASVVSTIGSGIASSTIVAKMADSPPVLAYTVGTAIEASRAMSLTVTRP